jgi:hypothetical protein
LEVLGPCLDKGLYAGIALAEGSKGRQDHHRIGRQMMRLEIVMVQEILEEITNWQSESSLKM